MKGLHTGIIWEVGGSAGIGIRMLALSCERNQVEFPSKPEIDRIRSVACCNSCASSWSRTGLPSQSSTFSADTVTCTLRAGLRSHNFGSTNIVSAMK